MSRPPDHRYPPATAVFALLAFLTVGMVILITALNAYAEYINQSTP